MPYKEGKSFVGQVKIKNEQTGAIEKYRKKGFTLKSKAQEWEKEKKKELKALLSDSEENWPIKLLCLKYLDEFKGSIGHYKEKNSILQHFMTHLLPDSPISRITPKQISLYLAELNNIHGANVANKYRKHLNTMFTWFEHKYLIKCNPVNIVPKLEYVSQGRYIPCVEDILAVLDACGPDDYWFLVLYFTTGARKRELFRLTWQEDVDFENRRFRLGSRKNRQNKIIFKWLPMNSDCEMAFKFFWNNRISNDQKFVLVCRIKGPHFGNPYKNRDHYLLQLCALANVKRFDFHSMRHVFIQMLGQSRHAGPNEIRMLARHESLSTTSKYSNSPDPVLYNVIESATISNLRKKAVNKIINLADKKLKTEKFSDNEIIEKIE